MKQKKESKTFIVNFKDIADKEKNPNFSLSAKSLLNNPKIKKRFLK